MLLETITCMFHPSDVFSFFEWMQEHFSKLSSISSGSVHLSSWCSPSDWALQSHLPPISCHWTPIAVKLLLIWSFHLVLGLCSFTEALCFGEVQQVFVLGKGEFILTVNCRHWVWLYDAVTFLKADICYMSAIHTTCLHAPTHMLKPFSAGDPCMAIFHEKLLQNWGQRR